MIINFPSDFPSVSIYRYIKDRWGGGGLGDTNVFGRFLFFCHSLQNKYILGSTYKPGTLKPGPYKFGCTHICLMGMKHRSQSTVLYYNKSRLPAIGIIAFWSATPENYFRPTAQNGAARSRGLAHFSGRGPCKLITDRLSPLPVHTIIRKTKIIV